MDLSRELIDGLVRETGQLLRSDRLEQAGLFVAEALGAAKPGGRDQAAETVWTLVAWCLGRQDYASAAELCWGPSVFSAKPRSVRMIWDAIEGSVCTAFVGGSSMGKSYSAGAWLLLDWLADPLYTTVKVVGPSEEHLRANLFTHLVTMHKESYVPLPGKIQDLFIGLNPRQRKSSISGVVVPIGKTAAGRLQGTKRFPRRGGKPHPTYGLMSRLRVFMDESENIAPGIWSDVDNLVSNAEGKNGFKVMIAYNPKDASLPCGQRAEPVQGWGNVDPEKDERWVSKRGWTVVRLDPEKSENVLSGKTEYPGIQTRQGLELLAQQSGGRESAGYYTFGRGLYPKTGTSFGVIPAGLLHALHATPLYLERPIAIAGGDLALEGGDNAILAHGVIGAASGLAFPKSILFPDGHTLHFKDKAGRPFTRRVAQLAGLDTIPKGQTVAMAQAFRARCGILGIPPDRLVVDRTGHGAGVHDYMREFWGPVLGINYSQSASHTKITDADKQFCDEEFDRIMSELWFAAKMWMEFHCVCVAPGVNIGKLQEQLGGRHYNPGKKAKVEAKDDYKNRTGQCSPDEADGFTLFVHAARTVLGEPISMLSEQALFTGNRDTRAIEDLSDYAGETIVDVTNRTDRLD